MHYTYIDNYTPPDKVVGLGDTCTAREVGVGAAAGGAGRAGRARAQKAVNVAAEHRELLRIRNPVRAAAFEPMAFRMLSSAASGGLGGWCPC
jgi:hypothetical protein